MDFWLGLIKQYVRPANLIFFRIGLAKLRRANFAKALSNERDKPTRLNFDTALYERLKFWRNFVFAICRFGQMPLLNGNLQMTSGIVVGRDFGHFTHGYCGTSISSQGKTVDHVLVGQSAESLGRASSLEQFNASVSRAKYKATIFTDDKTALLRAVSKSSARPSAYDLLTQHRRKKILKRIYQQAAARQMNVLKQGPNPAPNVAGPSQDHPTADVDISI